MNAHKAPLPAIDRFWQEVRDFVLRHPVSLQHTVAPAEFGAHLPGAVPYEEAAETTISELECAVLHKGMLAKLPPDFSGEIVRRLVPSFANEVFVVYCREVFEPLTSAEHIKALLEQLPAARVAVSDMWSPLAVYTGNGRMICRDRDFRKIVVPVRATRLIGALTRGKNPVARLRDAIAPALSGARKLIDYGAGIGLFAAAAGEVISRDAVILAVETDDVNIPCLVTNVEMTGLFWRTEFLTSRPTRLADTYGSAAGRRKKFLWVEKKVPVDLSGPCDALHIDLGFGLGGRRAELADFLTENGFPAIVLSHGLSIRPAKPAATDEAAIAEQLVSLGYEIDSVGSASADAAETGSITVLRHPS